MTSQALRGVRVLDLSRLLPGPFASLILADMGAEVIKIENPQGGDYIRWAPPYAKQLSSLFLALNRNKKSVALNLKDPDAREIFLKLAKTADVVLESFRPGVMQKLGIDYQTLRELNPGIIFCSISGYGQDGPYRLRAGHDLNYLGLSGALSLSGRADSPPAMTGFQLGDVGGGALFGAVTILGALNERHRTGVGQQLDISMTEGAASFMIMNFAEHFVTGVEQVRGRQQLNGGKVCYQVYATRDAKHMTLGALEPKFWQAFCNAVKRPDLLSGHMEDAAADNPTYLQLVELFKSKTRDEWTAVFANCDACCEPVLELSEIAGHPQHAHRNLVFDSHHPSEGTLRELALPFTDRDNVSPAPKLGEHTTQLCEEIGLTADAIAEFAKRQVLSCGK